MSDETARRELDAAIRDFGEAWARGDVGALKECFHPVTLTPLSEGEFRITTSGWNTLAAAAVRPLKSPSLTLLYPDSAEIRQTLLPIAIEAILLHP